MVIPMLPPIQVPLDGDATKFTSTAIWKPKMKYKYSLNPFCGCSDYIIGEEPYTFDDYMTGPLAYMRAANQLFTEIPSGMIDRLKSFEEPKDGSAS